MPLWVRPEDNYDPLPPPPETGWEETTILAAGLVPENDDQLVRALIAANPVLAGRCLYDGQAKVDKAIRQEVIEALLTTIARPEVALQVRIVAGEILGYLGDPRLGEMVTVQAGKFIMGEGNQKHSLFLPEYQLGKYPLTNAEYKQFIEAGSYREKRWWWWTEAGWKEKKERGWAEPRSWDNSRFNKPNQPVVGVSWYECVAYCRWLSAETGQIYRLPTEAEWEKGARGVDGRQYPWGNTFEASRLNADEGKQRVRTTTPVGIYPTGVSPFAVFDCAGNVWEWCATKLGRDYSFKPYPYDVTEDEWSPVYLEGTNVRVLRGGSWVNYVDFARCPFRDWDGHFVEEDFNNVGCRLVVSPSR
jgi:formylglycine-generating enzyme required for sulfatase activity